MKKRKFNLLLQIATLCLCVAAIAFGVYSAKTASLNVSGTIGFEAHNCNVSIATTITGAATQDFGDKATEENPISKPAVNIDATSSYKGTLNLGDLFFTDKDTVNDQAAPIKMKFAISNKSAFAIKASVTLPTSDEVTILADKDSIKIEAGSKDTPTVGYITVTFKINTPDTGINQLNFSTNKFMFDFTKFDTKKSDIEVKYDASGLLSNYYIEYGTNKVTGETKLKWYIIGTYGDDGQVQKLSTKVSDYLDNGADSSTFKMKDDLTYAFMSEYTLPSGDATKNGTKYVPINNNCFHSSNDSIGISNEFTDVNSNDYSISMVRAYLNGKTIYTESNSQSATINGVEGTKYTPKTDGASTNYFTQNTLKGDAIYTLIQPRKLSSLYAKMSDSNSNPQDVTIPTDKTEGISRDDTDAFLLLSYNEAFTLLSDENSRIGNLPTSSTASEVGEWIIRSPYTENPIPGLCIEFTGGDRTILPYNLVCGVRPAFLI